MSNVNLETITKTNFVKINFPGAQRGSDRVYRRKYNMTPSKKHTSIEG